MLRKSANSGSDKAMNNKAFQSESAGKLVQTSAGYAAFVPAKLPPRIEYDTPLILSLSRADAALSELAGLGRHLPNPHLLIGPYIRREAVLSSRIEGTKASLSDLLIDEMEQSTPRPEDTDLREVRNYVAAMTHGIDRLRTLPLSLRLVRELHALLMKGVRGEQATPGEFRRSQNWIGPAGSTIATASDVPPPPDCMDDLLTDWEQFLHEKDMFPDLVQCAIMHEQF
ncbi:hypothetical protein YTPLAS18_37030 [Nitrospira sp.]|nr:hypothetical protein YTPLAS18_37030 [Nitrospira sp.]